MIGAIATRLAAQLPELGFVGTTAELAAVVEGAQRHALPAAYVHPVRETASENRIAIGPVRQQVTKTVGVLLVVSATSQARTAGVPDAVEAIAAAVRGALLGWAPDAEHSPMELGEGSMERIAGGTAWWLQHYITRAEESG